MQAVVYHGQYDVRFQDWPDPPPPKRDEVQVAILSAAICGTDLDEYVSGPHLVPLSIPHPVTAHVGPLVLGHEMFGRVVRTGADVDQPRVGDRVVSGSGVWCGHCSWCLEGRTNLCSSYYTIGLHVDGGLAERVNVPARICQSIGDCSDDLAVLAQPLAVALHALRGCRVPGGEALVVVGVGGIGALLTTACAAQAVDTIAVDVSPASLAVAERLGARVIDASSTDVVAAVRRLTAGEGANVVVECSGTPAGLAAAVGSVRRGGVLRLVGLHRDASPLDLTRLVLDEITISSSKVHVYEDDLPAAVEMIATHGHIFEHIIDTVVTLGDVVPASLARMAAGEVHGRIVVRL